MSPLTGMIPGSFDPPTRGHIDLITRASLLCENLYVVIACNPEKKYLFSSAERKEMLEQILAGYKNIKVCIWNGMVVDFAKENSVGLIFRGVRNMDDFEYETELSNAYKSMMPEIEVAFLLSKPEMITISSTAVRKKVLNGSDVSAFVPEEVLKMIQNKTDC